MQITWPSDQVTEIINDIRDAIGRPIGITVKTAGSGCPICTLDPLTNLSIDPFCPVCSGIYYLNNTFDVSISGHVVWTDLDTPTVRTGGRLPAGDCYVTIAWSGDYLTYINNSENFHVDGKTLTLKHYQLKGKPLPNRIKIVLVQEGD